MRGEGKEKIEAARQVPLGPNMIKSTLNARLWQCDTKDINQMPKWPKPRQ